MSKNSKLFFRTFYISSVITVCLAIGIYGVSQAYKSIRLVGFGEYRNAVEIKEGKLKILDFEWDFG